MTKILVFGVVTEGVLAEASLEAMTVAKGLGTGTITGALIGSACSAAAEHFAAAGCSELLVVEDARLAPYCADLYVAAAIAIIEASSAGLVLFPQSPDIGEWVPLLAGRLGAALASGCTAIRFEGDTLIVSRPVCGGAVEAEYEFDRPLRFATIAVGAYPAAEAGTPCPVTSLALGPTLGDVSSRVTLLKEVPEAVGSGPSLKKARIVVSGGMGVGMRENWALIEDAASALGAAVGASRPIVELGWVPVSQQVGFSGQKIQPDLYIAVGISGAVHHLAGLAAAKNIVAINKDPEASIFRAARFGVVGDIKDVVPAFAARVRELREE